MDHWNMLLRTVLIYCVVFIVMRFMGKREIGKLTVFDLVVSVMIAEIAVFVIEDPKRNFLEGIVPIAALFCIQVGVAALMLKSRHIRLWFDGTPSIIMADGKLNREEMRKQRYNLDDLLLQLRENQIVALSEVDFAILETSGKLSIIKKDSGYSEEGDKKTAIPEGYQYVTLPIPLIMDGKAQDENLEKLGKNRFWLKQQLKSQGIQDIKQVYLCTMDHRGELYMSKV